MAAYAADRIAGDAQESLRYSSQHCFTHRPTLTDEKLNPEYQKARRSAARFDNELERISRQATGAPLRIRSIFWQIASVLMFSLQSFLAGLKDRDACYTKNLLSSTWASIASSGAAIWSHWVQDECHGSQMATSAIVMQHNTQRPVQLEITVATRETLQAWIKQAELKLEVFLFSIRPHASSHPGTRQYTHILGHWVDKLELDRADYGTHSMRRTKASSSTVEPKACVLSSYSSGTPS